MDGFEKGEFVALLLESDSERVLQNHLIHSTKPSQGPPSASYTQGTQNVITAPRDLEVGLALRVQEGQTRSVMLLPGKHRPSPHPSIRDMNDHGTSSSRQ
jgi:hypothetical protein